MKNDRGEAERNAVASGNLVRRLSEYRDKGRFRRDADIEAAAELLICFAFHSASHTNRSCPQKIAASRNGLKSLPGFSSWLRALLIGTSRKSDRLGNAKADTSPSIELSRCLVRIR